MHPSLEYALICCVAAAGSFLLTPLARKLATRWGAVAWPRDRDVHAVATPRMGGVALFLGFAMAILIARRAADAAVRVHLRPGLRLAARRLRDHLPRRRAR